MGSLAVLLVQCAREFVADVLDQSAPYHQMRLPE